MSRNLRQSAAMFFVALLCSFLTSATLGAAEQPKATTSLLKTPPTIDGTIKDGEWRGAVQVTGMRSQKASPTWKTLEDRMASVYCGFSEDNLYVAVVSELPPTQRLKSQKRGRDSDKMVFDSSVEIWTCPYTQTDDGSTVGPDFYQFIVNSNGNILDNAFIGGKPDPGWNADWTIANKVHKTVPEDAPAWMQKHGVWVCEISVPLEDFGVEGNPVGRTMGLLIARNWHRYWDQSTWFTLKGRSWSDPGNYPPIRFTSNDPVVQIKDLGHNVFNGQLQLRAEIYNPGPARKVKLNLDLESSDMPGLSDSQTLTLPAGETVDYSYDIPEGRFHKTANHKAHLRVTSAEGDDVYMDWKTRWSQAAANPWPGVETGPQPDKAVRLAYYPSYKFIRVGINTDWLGPEAKKAREAEVVVMDADGEELTSGTMNWDGKTSTRQFEVGELPDGQYTASITVTGDGYERTFERHFKRIHYVWEDNHLGETKKVYPPFEPISVDDETVQVVMRKYGVGGLGLWDSVRARGNESPFKEMLAGPIQLVANGQTLQGDGKFTRKAGHAVSYEGQADHPAARVQVKTITEYDGCQKVILQLKPGKDAQTLNDLHLDIPIKDDLAPLFHVSSTSLRRNPAGATPEGTGVVWDSRDYPDGEWIGNFKCYLWTGGEERGLSFFADNDKNWVLQLGDEEEGIEEVACQELIRKNGTLTMRINLVQKPITLEKPRQIVFGLMASPAKPMPENWRNMLLNNQWHYAGKLPGYRTVEWGGSTYWGAAETMKETYPLNRDMSILDKIQEARLTARTAGMQQFIRAWKDRNLSDYKPRGRKNAQQIVSLVRHSIRRTAKTHPDFQTWYWEEFHSVSRHHPETQVFGNEWSGGYHKGSVHPLAPSYLDFQCWYGAEFIRRGIGLYFDNTFPKQAKDPLTTEAYRMPNGRMQASANMWRHREYFKRIWVLHQQLAPAKTKPIMMFHMTNTHIVPYMSFGQTNLDLEWRYSEKPFQARFSPNLLRTQSMGLQTGNVPFALAWERGAKGRMGGLMVHEVRCWFIKRNAKLMQQLLEFGYGRGAEVINYWDDNPPLEVSDDRCKWLLLKKDDQLMVLLCTWNENGNDISVSIDTDALEVEVNRAIDVMSDDTVEVPTGDFKVEMPGYGTRIYRLE